MKHVHFPPKPQTAGLIRVADTNGATPLHYNSVAQISAPESKRICLEQNNSHRKLLKPNMLHGMRVLTTVLDGLWIMLQKHVILIIFS